MSFSNILENGFIDETNKKALDVIKSERAQYDVVWNTIESYCKKHNLSLSNKYILTDNANDPLNIYDKVYSIYTSNPFRHANNLCNEIHKSMHADKNMRYTRMKTISEKESFVIDYNMRQVAFINKLQKHKHDKEPHKVTKPVKINKLLYIPSEIELIDVYHALYDPSKYDDVNENLKFEKTLFDQVVRRQEKGILGGSCRQKKRDQLEALKVGLVTDWIRNKDNMILIGPWAHDWIKTGSEMCLNKEKVQIISDLTADELKPMLQSFVNTMTKFDITYRDQKLHIPKDTRTVRYTFYVKIQTDRGVTEKPFLDLFPIAQFELVPYKVVDKMRIGTKWVQLRFLLIDLWVIRVIQGLGFLTPGILQKKIAYLWELIKFFRNKYTIDGNIQFLGTYKDALIHKKMGSLGGRNYYPYYPEAYLKSKGKYRKI